MRDRLNDILGKFLILLMSAMTLDVLWGVFTRYALSNQASWTEELARFLLIWIGILGAAYAAGQHKHLAIDLLSHRMSQVKAIRLRQVILTLVSLFVLTTMVIGGSNLILLTFELGQLSPALKLPMGIVYSVIPISGVLILYYNIDSLLSTEKMASWK